MSENKYRKCSKCGNFYPETLDYFHKNGQNKFGLDPCCKICRNKKHVEYRRGNKDKIKQYDFERRKQFREKNGIFASPLHKYIKNHKTKEEYCLICNQKKKLQLASIGHTYTKDPIDYMWVCQSCHYLFDKCMEAIIV